MSRYVDIEWFGENVKPYSLGYYEEDEYAVPISRLAEAPSIEIPQWISCGEKLPENSGDYLVCPSDSVLEDYSDFSEVMIMPYDADCEGFGWWIDRYDPISLGFVDSDFKKFKVLAWMPLPKPCTGECNDSDNI